MRPKTPTPVVKDRNCFCCTHGIDDIDYKDIRLLQRFTTSYGKIVARRRSGMCMRHQRMAAQAIKRARIMALLPFMVR